MGHSQSVKMMLAAVVALLAVLVFSGSAPAEMRIFELQHRPAAELADMVRQLVSPDAKVAAHRNTLVVNTTPEELAEVARLVSTYDRSLKMLRITVDQGKSIDAADSEIRVSGRLQSGSATIYAGGRHQPADSSVFVSTGDGNVMISGQDRKVTERRQASQFMNVLEGSAASIHIGRAVPFTSQLRYYSRRHPHFVETVEYHNVDTGFEVLPEVHGNVVRLEIRPFMAFLDRENPSQVVFSELSTIVDVPLGKWYELGGHLGSGDGLSREILGSGSRTGTTANNIRIRVDSN